MKDESFHLTPLDIRRYDFGNALRGYDKQRVEQFREQVAHEVERLVRQCQEFEAKARGFHEQLKAFRDRDKALNDALVSAQQLRAEIREQAEREAQLILREARAEGERLVEEARNGLRKMEAELEAMVRQRRAYLSQMRNLIEHHLAEVRAAEAAPGSVLPGVTTPAVATTPGDSATQGNSVGRASSVVPPNESGPTAEEVGPRDATETPPWLRDLVKD